MTCRKVWLYFIQNDCSSLISKLALWLQMLFNLQNCLGAVSHTTSQCMALGELAPDTYWVSAKSAGNFICVFYQEYREFSSRSRALSSIKCNKRALRDHRGLLVTGITMLIRHNLSITGSSGTDSDFSDFHMLSPPVDLWAKLSKSQQLPASM